MAGAILQHGFQLRHSTMDDVQGVTDLLMACDIADYGKPTSSRATVEEFTRSYWESPDIDLEKNAWVVLTSEYSTATKRFFRTTGAIHQRISRTGYARTLKLLHLNLRSGCC